MESGLDDEGEEEVLFYIVEYSKLCEGGRGVFYRVSADRGVGEFRLFGKRLTLLGSSQVWHLITTIRILRMRHGL